jgi:flagellar biogenesis protein FliO
LTRLLTAVTMILLGSHPARLAAQAAGPPPAAAADEEGPGARQPASPGAPGSRTPLTPQNAAGRAGTNRDPGGLCSALTVGGSLAAVLAGFFVVAWALRRASPRGFGVLPAEAFEVLGRAPLANRQQAQLLRCGNKLLLVAVGAEGAETLTEITDPAEVERLAAVCRRARPSGSALGQVFRRREKHDAD